MTSPSGRLAGRVAVVTGAGQAAGETIGNGRATALTFAREGAHVIVVDRKESPAEGTREMIAAEGGAATVVVADVAVEEDWRTIVATCLDRFGRLDIVHNNVGIGIGDGWSDSIELDAWQRIMTVNAGSAVLAAKTVLPTMREQERGVITNVSSIAAVVAGTSVTTKPPLGYKMSKAALHALTQALAVENAEYGIRVNAILPGLVETPMGVDSVVRAFGLDRDRYVAARNAAVPLKGGMGTAWDVAAAALFLASDDARFITGVLLPVDGGQSARVG